MTSHASGMGRWPGSGPTSNVDCSASTLTGRSARDRFPVDASRPRARASPGVAGSGRLEGRHMLKRWWIAVGSFALVGCSGAESRLFRWRRDGGRRCEVRVGRLQPFRRPKKDKAPKLTPQTEQHHQPHHRHQPGQQEGGVGQWHRGTFVRPPTAGRHWTVGVVPGGETLQFRDVQGVSDKVAYLLSIGVADTDSRIYKTTDGGQHLDDAVPEPARRRLLRLLRLLESEQGDHHGRLEQRPLPGDPYPQRADLAGHRGPVADAAAG